MRKRTLMTAVLVLTLGAMAWASTETIIYTFNSANGGTDGYYPNAGLTADKLGNLYGTTYSGGNGSSLGVAFELKPIGGGNWAEIVLHTFAGGSTDGYNPNSPLVFDTAGNLYGMTRYGGTNNLGTVYELTKKNGSWTETIIHSFAGSSKSEGEYPDYNALSFDSSGNLYGVTEQGGSHGYGTVFTMTLSKGVWKFRTIHNFAATNDGAYPEGGLIPGANGYFYGATYDGGAVYNAGTIYQMFQSRGAWVTRVISTFTTGLAGQNPVSGVTADSAGNLYGATLYGGTDNKGVVFKLIAGKNNTWTPSVIHSFLGGNDDGYGPQLGDEVILDSAGNVYGMTVNGGTSNIGAVYQLKNEGGGNYKGVLLHSFTNNPDGCYPRAGLLIVKTTLYGTASNCGGHGGGIAFKLAE